MRYARNPEVLWRSTSGGPVVLAPGRDDPGRLGGLAAVVWEVLDRPLDRQAIDAEVTALMGSEASAEEALMRLCEEGLLVRVD